MLVNMCEILQKSREGKYGVVAPNICNEDSARVAIQVAEENNAPIILDVIFNVTPDIELLGKIVRDMAEKATVPVALNLDHGGTFEQAMIAIRAGFSSIMVDRSSLPYEQNVAEVSELVKIAHAVGLSVEAELGHVGVGAQYDEDRNAGLTDPAQAKAYVEATGVDALAIAIGTAHGKYVGTPYLDFDLLEKIYAEVDVPLVLHGGSGSGDENLAKATSMGITKVNIGTDLFQAGIDNLVAHHEELKRAHLGYELMAEGYKAKLLHYMKLFNQCDKA
ncbi:class II fructose-bisphosphate aldolase [Ruminococcus sp. AF14-10]|nr:class II fructose-bisphosphate aldolase [Ruminococcus sp. AF14-10]